MIINKNVDEELLLVAAYPSSFHLFLFLEWLPLLVYSFKSPVVVVLLIIMTLLVFLEPHSNGLYEKSQYFSVPNYAVPF